MRSRLFADIAWIALVAVAYFLTAQLGLGVALAADQVRVAVWPSAGIALAALRVFGYRVWPGIAIGAFFAYWMTNEPATTSCGIACGNTLAALAGTWVLTHVVDFDDALERFRDALGLLILAAGFSTLLSATIGAASLCASGIQPWADFGSLWGVWWLGDAMGDLVVAPALLVWVTARRRTTWAGWKIAEALTLSTVLFGVGWLSFARRVASPSTQHAYPVFPVVVWAALRFGPLGTTTATFLFSFIGIIGAISGFGPFEQPTLNGSLTLLQMFMAVVATTGLLLAAATSERAQSQELLQDSDRRKDEFLATLAHELRNPLASISNITQLVRLKNTIDPELRELTEIIERQIHQMTRLVEDLLDISRIARGQLELRKELVELATVVENAVETARPIIEARSHELWLALPAEPIRLEADPIRLAQVFSNLLNNSAKFTPSAGRIELFATRREADVVVTVRDNGVGIPASDLSRIFEIFAQVKHSGRKSLNGLGIGLALVKRLVEMHGGTIEADSQGAGRGSEFRVRLPAVVAPPVQEPQPIAGNGCRLPRRSRILIVDDNKDSVASLSRLLVTLGSEIRQAYNGCEAVEAAEIFRPDVVLLDIGMPVLDGYEAARHIRSQEWAADVLLIALTGCGWEEERQRSVEAGFDFYLTKPVDLPSLRSLLENLGARMPTRG